MGKRPARSRIPVYTRLNVSLRLPAPAAIRLSFPPGSFRITETVNTRRLTPFHSLRALSDLLHRSTLFQSTTRDNSTNNRSATGLPANRSTQQIQKHILNCTTKQFTKTRPKPWENFWLKYYLLPGVPAAWWPTEIHNFRILDPGNTGPVAAFYS